MRIAIDWPKLGKDLSVFAAISAFMAFINPYNATGSLSYPYALLYWLGMVVGGGLFADLIMALYQRLRPRGSVWGRLVVGAVTAAIFVTAFIILVETIYNNGIAMPYWWRLYGLVLVISIAITVFGYVVEQAFENNASAPSGNSSGPLTTFMQRLPIKYRAAELHAVSSEDHYLRVHTSVGEELILMRLADAVRELGGAAGLQVHRSWWVAKAGIADEKRENGRRLLILKSGAEVPVSRSYRAKAKDAGLIQ